MNQAKLPFYLEAKTIAMMMPGETLYAVPWTMVVDEDRLCWLRGNYGVFEAPRGTVTAEIHRNSEGFEVRLHDGHRFSIQHLRDTLHRDWDLRPVTALVDRAPR